MKVLISGICGFVGSNLARGLLDNVSGRDIIGLAGVDCAISSQQLLEHNLYTTVNLLDLAKSGAGFILRSTSRVCKIALEVIGLYIWLEKYFSAGDYRRAHRASTDGTRQRARLERCLS